MAIQIWQPGDKIKNDRFEILKQLGKGGFGITYLAEDTIKKQQIVIKTLNANQQGEADFVQKQGNFVNEGFMLKTFNHPHIVKVYEMIQVGDLSGLVMEYIPGQDLADYIIANGRLGEAEALNYIDQIAQALDCVHQQKFFHRDVKPHNIMLRQDRGEAVLIDFGIAKEFVDLETIYLSNSLGTELYKPIEQYEKRGQFGAYTDIYALAVTLYHLLTGAAPGGGSYLYRSKERKDARDKGLDKQLDEHLWGELEKAGVSNRTQLAIKAGMEIEPSQRPQNMTEFLKLLGLVQEAVVPIVIRQIPSVTSPTKIILPPRLVITRRILLLTSALFTVVAGIIILITIFDKKEPSLTNLSGEIDGRNIYLRSCDERRYKREFKEALTSCNEAVKKFPSELAFSIRGDLNKSMGNNQDALDDYNQAIELNTDGRTSGSYIVRGDIKSSLGKKKEALSDYNKAIDILNKDSGETVAEIKAHAYNNRGNVNSSLGHNQEALSDYNIAIVLNPKYADAYRNRGNIKSSLGKKQDATIDYSKASILYKLMKETPATNGTHSANPSDQKSIS
jgi:serine/threonine protein kinase